MRTCGDIREPELDQIKEELTELDALIATRRGELEALIYELSELRLAAILLPGEARRQYTILE